MTTENPTIKETITANIENMNDNMEAEKEHQAYYKAVRGSIKRSIKTMEAAEEGTSNPDGKLMGRNGYHTSSMNAAIQAMYVSLVEVEELITASKTDLKTLKTECKAAEKYLSTLRD